MAWPFSWSQLVGEFMNHDIAAILRVGSTLQYVLPGQDDLPLRPGFACQRLALGMVDAGSIGVATVYQKRRRVQQDLTNPGKVVRWDARVRLSRSRQAWAATTTRISSVTRRPSHPMNAFSATNT